MASDTVWKGLAHVRPRPEADFSDNIVGAYVVVLVLGHDTAHLTDLVADAMDDHDCDLVDMELEPLPTALERDGHGDGWGEIAGGLTEDRRIWCAGTFHTYSDEDEDDG